jgi:hypothetical protein
MPTSITCALVGVLALRSMGGPDPRTPDQRSPEGHAHVPDARPAHGRSAESRAAPGRHHDTFPNLLGVKAGPLLLIEPGREGQTSTLPITVVGVFYERVLLHEWLELEISLPLGVGQEDRDLLAFLPIDVHVKKPFHPFAWLSPYIGVGPTMDLVVSPELEAFFGGSLAVGTYIWASHPEGPANSDGPIVPRSTSSTPVGFDFEVDYNVVGVHGEVAHEILIAAGPIWRF